MRPHPYSAFAQSDILRHRVDQTVVGRRSVVVANYVLHVVVEGLRLMGQTVREEFARWLRDQLRSQGWMVSDFAQEVGVRPSAVYRWTAGQRAPTDSQVDKIAVALKVSPGTVWEELARSGVVPTGPTNGEKTNVAKPTRVAAPVVPPEERPFGRWLREQLAQRGWTAGFLARKIDLDVVTVRAWAGGLRQPASMQVSGIARALELDEEAVRAALES